MRNSDTPVRGYALSIAPLRPGGRPIAGFVDASPVLVPETTVANDNGRRRFRFVEQIGAKPSPRQLRSVGDVFCVDFRTADFIRDAINEKIAREGGAEFDFNRIRIFGATVTQIDGEDVCKIAAERMLGGETVTFEIVLQSPSQQRQDAGQRVFSTLCRAAGIDHIEDADQLLGAIVTYRLLGDSPAFDRSPAVRRATAA